MQPLCQNRLAGQSVCPGLMLSNARNIRRSSLVRQNREKQTIRRLSRRLHPYKKQLLAHVLRASKTQAKFQGYKQILLTSQSHRIRQHRKKLKGRRSPDAYPSPTLPPLNWWIVFSIHAFVPGAGGVSSNTVPKAFSGLPEPRLMRYRTDCRFGPESRSPPGERLSCYPGTKKAIPRLARPALARLGSEQ
jgi:hypothetical protein